VSAKAAIGAVAKWSALGAVFAGGALVVARFAGPRVVTQLGRAGGEGFIEGTTKAKAALDAISTLSPPTLGRW